MSGKEKEFEQDDPMELVGFVMDSGDEDEEQMREEMGRTFVDEFLRMGWPPDAILRVFRDPFYRAPHAIFVAKGEPYVVNLIDSVKREQSLARTAGGSGNA